MCFRNLQKETDEAIVLFTNSEARGTIILRIYEDYYYGYEDENEKYYRGYSEIIGEEVEKSFIALFSSVLKLKNILSSFDNFEENKILNKREFQDYTCMYNDLHEKIRHVGNGDRENINDDIVFEMELVKQIEVNIDYILNLLIQLMQKVK